MITLESAWDTVLMLLIAFGVGLLGGIGGAMLEQRQAAAAAIKSPGKLRFAATTLLGGIAAVAILYFFSPEHETVIAVAGKEPATATTYSLTELVALSLIIGSAGPAFLATMQTKTTALLEAQKSAAATEATATQAIGNVADQASTLAKASVASAAPKIEEALQQASGTTLSTAQVQEVVAKIADEAEASLATDLESHVESAKAQVAEASGSPTHPASATE